MELLDSVRAAIELLLVGLGYLRYIIRRSQSRRWPETSGIVQPGGVERLSFLLPFRYYIVFGYAFKANGARYAGFFALAADDWASVVVLQALAPELTVTVRYKPDNSDVSLLEDEQMLGRKIIQNRHWLG